jgi:hypothetical protein
VGEGVHADLVPFGDDPAQQLRVPVDLRADDEERRVRVGRLQRVEDLRGPPGIRAIVVRESHGPQRHRRRAYGRTRVDTQHRPRPDRGNRVGAGGGRLVWPFAAGLTHVSGEAQFGQQD